MKMFMRLFLRWILFCACSQNYGRNVLQMCLFNCQQFAHDLVIPMYILKIEPTRVFSRGLTRMMLFGSRLLAGAGDCQFLFPSSNSTALSMTLTTTSFMNASTVWCFSPSFLPWSSSENASISLVTRNKTSHMFPISLFVTLSVRSTSPELFFDMSPIIVDIVLEKLYAGENVVLGVFRLGSLTLVFFRECLRRNI